MCCQVEVSATDRSLVQRSPTVCGLSHGILSRNFSGEAVEARVGLLRRGVGWGVGVVPRRGLHTSLVRLAQLSVKI